MTSRDAPTIRIQKAPQLADPTSSRAEPPASASHVRDLRRESVEVLTPLSDDAARERGIGTGSTLPPPRTEATTVPAIPALRASVLSPAQLLAARLPDGYELVKVEHEGRWADIWHAVDDSGRPVALKLARSRNPETATRFEAEARALANLTHRSIVRLHAHGTTSDDRSYIALEWLEGQSLSRTLEIREAGLPPVDAIRLLLPIAYAMLLVHDRGFVHGDLRAEHVMLVPLGEDRLLPKIVDFGAVNRVPPPKVSFGATDLALPPPPSDRLIPEGDPAVDVRAFAALVFHAIMGRPPFQPESPSATHRVAEVPRSGLSERDAVLWRILAQGLAPLSVKHRMSLHELAKALAQWADLRGVEADVTGSFILPRWSDPPPAIHRGPPRGG